ncbi:hypothetical protein KSF81_01550 [Siccirubricoccus sp. G192]|nr:hypothetical protein [Siccirubricoccus sp. G192]
MPAQFGIDTGFIFDASANISKQIDVIIYRTGYHPVFEIGGIKHFVVESVVAAIEIKSAIEEEKILMQALDNIKSVKTLDRSNSGKNYIVGAFEEKLDGNGDVFMEHVYVNKEKFDHQVFCAIFTQSSMTELSVVRIVREFLAAHPEKHLWPNLYSDINGISLCYISEGSNGILTTDPQKAAGIAVTRADANSSDSSLIQATFEIMNFLRIAPLIDFKPTSYFPINVQNVQIYNLP